MALDGRTWRVHPFEVGALYQPKFDFNGVGARFLAGRSYRLIHVGHSHYDDCSVFTFVEADGPETLAWWWSDEEPESACDAHFQRQEI